MRKLNISLEQSQIHHSLQSERVYQTSAKVCKAPNIQIPAMARASVELTALVALPDGGALVFKLVIVGFVVGGPLVIQDSKLENAFLLEILGLVVVGSVVVALVVVGFIVETPVMSARVTVTVLVSSPPVDVVVILLRELRDASLKIEKKGEEAEASSVRDSNTVAISVHQIIWNDPSIFPTVWDVG